MFPRLKIAGLVAKSKQKSICVNAKLEKIVILAEITLKKKETMFKLVIVGPFFVIYNAKLLSGEKQPTNPSNVCHSTVLASLQKRAVRFSSLLHCE